MYACMHYIQALRISHDVSLLYDLQSSTLAAVSALSVWSEVRLYSLIYIAPFQSFSPPPPPQRGGLLMSHCIGAAWRHMLIWGGGGEMSGGDRAASSKARVRADVCNLLNIYPPPVYTLYI